MDVQKTYSVSEISSLIKEILEGSFTQIRIEGEISNCRPSSTGHLYFTLKDESSMISAVMFKNKMRCLPFTPQDGMLIRAFGSISVYEARGSYQIIVEQMEMAGTGDILRILEERKQKLAKEGLFDPANKKQIPSHPEKIALITSPTGAALQDILNIIKRRNPALSIVLLPAPVQGQEAASVLTQQVQIANLHKMADVIIIGRGGGSLEDLLPFSDETLVRAIASSKIPIISAVGHEIDWALSDFAADLRAPTPSAAAELVSPLAQDLIQKTQYFKESLLQQIQAKIHTIRLQMATFSTDSLEMRFRKIEQPFLMRFDDIKESLINNFENRIQQTYQKLKLCTSILEGGNPQLILEKGYSIVQNRQTGKTIKKAAEALPKTPLLIRTSQGIVYAKTEETEQ